MGFSCDDAMALLESEGQEHLLAFRDRLDDQQLQGLLAQIDGLDFQQVAAMRKMLARRDEGCGVHDVAPPEVVRQGSFDADSARAAGEEVLRERGVGVILVAGGQGSRLGFDGPKGSYPLAPVSNATLFEIHCRKILALERMYDAAIPFYIMTSEANNGSTQDFFAQHDHFGLEPERVLFFVQGMWPALTAEGKIILERPDHVFMGPDGHGGTLAALQRTGMLDDMAWRCVDTLFYFQVDNPLVEIADPVFLGLHRQRRAQMSVKACAKRDPHEGLGLIVLRDGRNAVIEYSDPLLTDEMKQAVLPNGELKFLFGSVAIHVFDLAFLAHEVEADLPLHIAHKKVPVCDADGNTSTPSAPNAFKFEKFIFDALPDADRVLNLEFAREDEFSPVKNAEGDDSPAIARRDMVRKAARLLESCGVTVPRDARGEPLYRIEIDPCYALGTEQLKDRLPAGFRVASDVLLR